MISNSFNSVYKGKRVLVTGHTGFKGSWLAIWLKELGAEVIGYSLDAETNPSNFKNSNLESGIHSYIGDIRDSKNLNRIIEKHKPEIVFHLAAQPIVRLSYDEPVDTYDTNLMGLINVFEALRDKDYVKVILNVTSDKCYENKEWVWGYRESEALGGHDPYSASKACAEIITSSYRKSFFEKQNSATLLASARAGNVIGGGDWAEYRIIPDFVKAISEGKSVEIRNPYSIRPWQHVLEPLSGYLWLAAKLYDDGEKFCEAWNFGPKPGDIIIVEDLVKIAIENWKGEYFVNQDPNAPHEAHYLQLDCSKAFHELNWKATLDVQTAIKMTIDWYKEFYESKVNPYDLCRTQIEYFTNSAIEQKIEWAGKA